MRRHRKAATILVTLLAGLSMTALVAEADCDPGPIRTAPGAVNPEPQPGPDDPTAPVCDRDGTDESVLADEVLSDPSSFPTSADRRCYPYRTAYFKKRGACKEKVVKLCATCGDGKCEEGETCTPSACVCVLRGIICTEDCGPLRCPGDCR